LAYADPKSKLLKEIKDATAIAVRIVSLASKGKKRCRSGT
jgi:hypothetical protein